MGGILWLMVFAVFFYFMMRFGCGAHVVHGGHGAGSGAGINRRGNVRSVEGTGPHKDPVCGMQFPASTGHSRMFQAREYRFCSQKCLDQFDAEPARYVTQAGVEK